MVFRAHSDPRAGTSKRSGATTQQARHRRGAATPSTGERPGGAFDRPRQERLDPVPWRPGGDSAGPGGGPGGGLELPLPARPRACRGGGRATPAPAARCDLQGRHGDEQAACRRHRRVHLGAWAADLDSDGDLDIVLGTRSGLPIALRNNGDNTFQVIHPLPNVSGLTAFVWADLDGDGAPDAALIDGGGHLHVFQNLHDGEFREWPAATPDRILAISAVDVDRDDVPDLVALRADGAILRLSRRGDGTGWETEEIARWQSPPADGSARLLWADLDNNGGPDLIATGSSGTQVWLSDPQGKLAPLAAAID